MSRNLAPSLLDQNQILQRVYDEANDRLRVDTSATIEAGQMEVSINHVDDSIKIGDGTDFLLVNPDGSLSTKILDSSGAAITGASNGVAGKQVIHVQTPDTTTSSVNFNGLASTIMVSVAGLNSVGFQLAAGSFVGTLQAQASIDGGTSWANVPFYDPLNSSVNTNLVIASANPLKILSVLPIGGASHLRVMVAAYTSGSAMGLLRASQVTGAVGAITAAAFSSISNTYPTLTADTPALILTANPNRKYAYISNNSGTTMYLQLASGTGLTSTTGLVVPSSSYYEFKGDNLYTGNIYGFSAGSITVSVTEGTP